MTAADILAWLRSVGAELSVVGDKLKVSASTGALTPEVRATITQHKQDLLELLREAEGPIGGGNPPIVPIERVERLPLSMFQQRLWILEQLRREDDPHFNMVTVWFMPGRDLELLKRSIGDVVRRHEILRSTIPSERATPYVRLLPPEAAVIEVIDLRHLSPADQHLRLDAEAHAAIGERFDLTSEPPLRWRIYIMEGGQLATQICADHIAVDEWSFVVLRRELDRSLEACAAGIALAPPALQYADYAAWERRRQSSPAVAAQLAWWQKRLTDLPRFCALPPDRHGRNAGSGAFRFLWDREFTAQLRGLAQTRRCTLFMVLLSALAVLLRAATGRGDIAVGTSLGVREHPDLESMIGAFVNVVVLRLDLEDDPSFAELLTRARETVLDAHEHREVSFETLVERLAPVRTLDFTPWFQVSVVMHNASAEEPSPIYSGGVGQNMTWFTRETESGLLMTLEYRSDLYQPDTIERVAARLETLLRAALDDPARRVSLLPLMSVRATHRARPGIGCAALSGCGVFLRCTQPARQPDREASGRSRGGPRSARRHLRGAHGGPSRRHARSGEDRRRVRSARPGISAGATPIHGGTQ